MFQSVPVCMYHHVNDHPDKYLTVSIRNFMDQMEFLYQEGYTTLSSNEFRAYKKGLARCPKKSVLLTFDDAWLDVFVNAFPIMRRYNIKFTVFVISERTERASKFKGVSPTNFFPSHHESEAIAKTPNVHTVVATWDNLREMIDTGLCSVQNHTATHGKLNNIRDDIVEGRQQIQSALGIETNQLAWPRGKYDKEKLKVVKELGIEVAYTTRRGANFPSFGPLKVKRFTVDDYGAHWLKRYLQIFSNPILSFVYARLKFDRRKAKLSNWLRGI